MSDLANLTHVMYERALFVNVIFAACIRHVKGGRGQVKIVGTLWLFTKLQRQS